MKKTKGVDLATKKKDIFCSHLRVHVLEYHGSRYFLLGITFD